MTEEKPDLEKFIDSVQEYLETRGELSKLQAVEKSSKMAGGMAVGMILFILSMIILVFLSIALAYTISAWAGKAYAGFLAVAGLYLLIAILLYVNREKWIQRPIMNGMIQNFFKDHEQKN